MKKILVITVLLLSLNSCKKKYNTYTVENSTKFSVKIAAFDRYHYIGDENKFLVNDNVHRIDSISIEPNSKYIVNKRIGEDNEPGRFFKTDEVDSVIIYFDTKKIIYSLYYTKRNINFISNFIENCDRSTGCDFIYTITQEDYDNAESIK